jgi:N-acetylmuramoyl-L-alanine amidase
MRLIRHIVLHCTATPQNTKVESILNHWKNVLGWKSPGYHFLIESDGRVNKLQPMNLPTNGVKGFNSNSIHISYIGGKDEDDRTSAQKESIIECINLALEYSKPYIPIIQGHRDFPNVSKACPRFNANSEYSYLRSF